MDFRILGPLWIGSAGTDLTPTAPKVRQVLAFLLVRCGNLVQVDELIDELWRDEPPVSAITTLQTYIYKIRKDVLGDRTSARLHTQVSGYVLDVPPERGDLLRFERMSREGRRALEAGDAGRAAELLQGALDLWRGPALADVSAGEILSAYVTRLEEERLHTLELRITADLEIGRHQQLVSELKMLVSEQPLNERFHAHLITALHRSGRRHEAMDTYRGLRSMLVSELGIEPSAFVQRLHLTLLDSDDDAADAPAVPAPREHTEIRPPAQLPLDIPDFVGRTQTLAEMRDYLVPGEEHTGMRMICIYGMAGVGKSALAIRAAHAVRGTFQDGQLYADLRGTSDVPADPHEVLDCLLRALGVRSPEIPDGLQERGKLFRSLVADRRMLLVLDDAASAAQVAPLLPASPGCGVLITSRRGLHSLPGTWHLHLGVMPVDEAVRLIESASGRRYGAGERSSAVRAAKLAGRLPIALRSLGSRMAQMRSRPSAGLVERLEDARRRLDMLAFADLDIRARLEASYRQLDPPTQRTFHTIGLLSPAFSAVELARLMNEDLAQVEARLAGLVHCSLLASVDTGGGETRYLAHELVRIFARERMEQNLFTSADAPTADTPSAGAGSLLPQRAAQAPLAVEQA